MRRVSGAVIVVLVALALAGCAGALSSAPGQRSSTATGAESADYVSTVLPAAYENALPASTQLALGMLRLEGTPQAVTPVQAKALLPLWQAFQGSALLDQGERNAVMKQIEGMLAPGQLQAIAAMQLTGEDVRAWMQEHGVGGPPQGTPGAPVERPGANLTDEQRTAMRATMEASGQGQPGFGGGQGQGPGARGTPGARGGAAFGRPTGAGSTQYRVLVGPLVKLLTARAAE
jgi:hypothetical protein